MFVCRQLDGCSTTELLVERGGKFSTKNRSIPCCVSLETFPNEFHFVVSAASNENQVFLIGWVQINRLSFYWLFKKRLGKKESERKKESIKGSLLFVVVGNCCCGKPIAKIGCAAAKQWISNIFKNNPKYHRVVKF